MVGSPLALDGSNPTPALADWAMRTRLDASTKGGLTWSHFDDSLRSVHEAMTTGRLRGILLGFCNLRTSTRNAEEAGVFSAASVTSSCAFLGVVGCNMEGRENLVETLLTTSGRDVQRRFSLETATGHRCSMLGILASRRSRLQKRTKPAKQQQQTSSPAAATSHTHPSRLMSSSCASPDTACGTSGGGDGCRVGGEREAGGGGDDGGGPVRMNGAGSRPGGYGTRCHTTAGSGANGGGADGGEGTGGGGEGGSMGGGRGGARTPSEWAGG